MSRTPASSLRAAQDRRSQRSPLHSQGALMLSVLRPLRKIAHLWPFGHKSVLILEDDTTMQKLVAKLLKSLPVRVEVFGNGRDVVQKIASDGERYDAFLVDVMMPHEGGLTVLRNLQQHNPALLRRVILMT